MMMGGLHNQVTNCPVGHLCVGDGCSIRSMCLDLMAQRAKEAAQMAEKEDVHHLEHGIHNPVSRKTDVIRVDCYMNGLGQWKVVAPNNHYRTAAHIDNLADCIRLVISDYGDFCRNLVARGPDGGSGL